MKNIKQIREEKEKVAPTSDEERKLTQLVRAGLFDAKKLSILKRALRKENIQMTRQERDTLLQLLDVLLDMITNNRQLFTKVKQSVNEGKDEEYSMARGEINTIISAAKRILDKLQGEGELEAWVQSKITKAEDYLTTVADHLEGGEALEEAKLDRTVRDINDLPNIIVLRRRSVRVFPEGYKVVMYWADKINRYIPIPVDPYVMTRGLDLNEVSPDLASRAYAERMRRSGSLEDDDPESAVQKYKAGKTLKRIGKKYGEVSKIRTAALGKNAEKQGNKQRDYQAGLKMRGPKGILSTAGQMARSGKPGAALGTLVGGAIGAGIRTLAKKMATEGIETTRIKMKKMSVSPLTGVKKVSSSNTMIRESFRRNLNENRQQIDEVVPLVAAGLATGARIALPAAARLASRYLPRLAGATKNVVKGTAKNLTKKVKDYISKKKTSLAAGAGYLAGTSGSGSSSSSSSGSKSSGTDYTTKRREVGRLQGQSSFAQARQGDYATRSTTDTKLQRSAMRMNESVIKTLKTIEEGAETTLTFKDGSQIEVGHLLAQKIINIYESVNKNNKQLMAGMLDESVDSFKKVSNFAISNRN